MIKQGTLKIELMSALCPGTGYSFAGLVDSDVSYDDCGIPYIQGKRLKGCLRDAVENSLYALGISADALFGEHGSDRQEGVRIGNARIRDYEKIHSELQSARKIISAQSVLARYTAVLGQTKIDENGIAQENSLRYTRVIGQKNPLKPMENLCFEAEIAYEETLENDLRIALKAVRNIGMRRSRGLGSVKCALGPARANAGITPVTDGKPSEERVIRYTLINEEPLMLCKGSDVASETMISGQTILGTLASRYLRKGSAEDEEFKDLFLRGKAIFTNAVIAPDEKTPHYPAPTFVNKLKKTKKFVNSNFRYDNSGLGTEYDPADGNQEKKLRGAYVATDGKSASVAEVEMQIIYHHTRKGRKNGAEDQGLLYTWKAVKPGQCFIGEIRVPAKYAEKVKALLLESPLYFGKSRTAQYGKCRVDSLTESAPAKDRTFKKGEWILVQFLSDAIFLNEGGWDTGIRFEDIRRETAKSLGISGKFDPAATKYQPKLEAKILQGYLAVWNLRRQPLPAISAGGSIPFLLTEDAEITAEFIGERNLEGYGQVQVLPMKDMSYKMEKAASENVLEKPSLSPETKALVRDILADNAMEKLKLTAIEQNEFPVSAATLGRITLMLKESLDENPDPKEAFKEFGSRIESIKREAVLKEGRKLLKTFGVKNGPDDNIIWKFEAIPSQDAETEISAGEDLGVSAEDVQKVLDARWGEYLMTVLVSRKNSKGE